MKIPPLSCCIAALILVAGPLASAVTLTNTDAIGQQSFTSGARWSDGLAPSADKDYEILGGFQMRTPTGTTNIAFPGRSLTIGDGVTAGNSLLSKRDGSTSVVTINDLRFNRGSFNNGTDGTVVTLAGNITLLAGGGTINTGTANARSVIITASISGVGALTSSPGTAANNFVILNPVGPNTYSGGTTIGGSVTDVRKDDALGVGDVRVNSGATLKLNLGATNDYIDDLARLILNTGTPTVNLAFTGAPDTISALSFDGGLTFVEPGLYGAVGNLDAAFTSARLTGSGLLLVIPEPTSATLALFGAALCGLRLRRRS